MYLDIDCLPESLIRVLYIKVVREKRRSWLVHVHRKVLKEQHSSRPGYQVSLFYVHMECTFRYLIHT